MINENEKEMILSETDEMDLDSSPLMVLLVKAMGFPYIKVNRTTFLMETYHLSEVDINGRFAELVSLKQMDAAAKEYIAKNVTQSTATAFALGLPGGFAMAATIPADIMQNFAFSLRLAQQMAYIYGFDNLYADNNEMDEKARYTMIAFLGVMFAASGSGTVLRAIAPNVGRYVAKQIMSKPLMKTVWYPMLKKITGVVASKAITKKGLQAAATKAVPVIGGVVSAGVNVATMIPMANRLKNELRKYHLSEEEIREIEEKDRVTFGEKASDAISDMAAGTVKAVKSTKEIGGKIGGFAKQVSSKTRAKMEKGKAPDKDE